MRANRRQQLPRAKVTYSNSPDAWLEYRRIRNRVWLQGCMLQSNTETIGALDLFLHRHRIARDGVSSDRPNYLRKLFAGEYAPRKAPGRGPLWRIEEALPGSSRYYFLPFWPLLEPTPIEALSREQLQLCSWLQRRLTHLDFRFANPAESRMWPQLYGGLRDWSPESLLAVLCGIFRVGCGNGTHTSVRCDIQAEKAFRMSCRSVAGYEAFKPHRKEFLDYMNCRFLPRTRGIFTFDSSQPDHRFDGGFVLKEFLASMAR